MKKKLVSDDALRVAEKWASTPPPPECIPPPSGPCAVCGRDVVQAQEELLYGQTVWWFGPTIECVHVQCLEATRGT